MKKETRSIEYELLFADEKDLPGRKRPSRRARSNRTPQNVWSDIDNAKTFLDKAVGVSKCAAALAAAYAKIRGWL